MENNMKPILEIRYNRFIYLLLAPIALALSGLFFSLVFLSDIMSEFQNSTAAKIVFSFFILVGAFLAVYWFRAFLKNEPIFTVYEEGFVSKTHGVNAGLIRWQDIRKIEQQQIRYGRGFTTALAVYLKQSDKYNQEQPLVVNALRSAVKATGLHQVQQVSATSEEDLPVFIPIEALGERYAQVKKIIDEKVAPNGN